MDRPGTGPVPITVFAGRPPLPPSHSDHRPDRPDSRSARKTRLYELTGFTNALAALALGVRGEFSFLPDGGGTMIRWTYEFKPRRGRVWIIAGPFRPLWQRYMQAALMRMAAIVVDEKLAGDSGAA